MSTPYDILTTRDIIGIIVEVSSIAESLGRLARVCKRINQEVRRHEEYLFQKFGGAPLYKYSYVEQYIYNNKNAFEGRPRIVRVFNGPIRPITSKGEKGPQGAVGRMS